ncbi:MAG TPA: ankyrin repeat domain-containing protein [Pyrinomonadaceae bacterium]|nr:ankyrin repeat domain-containing protein [Pyrinomonadaceae bacterium]
MSKRSLIDSIEVKSPCSEDWNEMTGNEKVRFCGHCDLNVNNISALTRKQAMRLVRQSNGRICIHYVKNPVDNSPIFAEKLYQISRRAGIAAGVLGASLSLSTLAYAQQETPVLYPLTTSVQTETLNDKSSKRDEPVIAVVNVVNDEPVTTDGVMSVVHYRSGLHRAVSNDDLEEVKDLIMRGENVNQKDENYSFITPLFLAVENGNVEIAETLLNFRAKVNAKDGNKQTPLMRLDEDASPELVNVLIKYGAKINLIDNDGNTALILASRSVKPEVLRLLINHSANLNAQNGEGRTALMEAADADNVENVRALLEAGASVNLTDKNGETALNLTTDAEIEKLLADYGAVVEKDSN